MVQETPMTQAGLEQLQAELDHLINVWRPDIAARIKSARELGDLKENGEYHAAKDEQGLVEAKISRLDERLRTAKIITDVDTSKGGIGTTVTVIDTDTGEREQYTITGVVESDPAMNKISSESPIGMALEGVSPGDSVRVQLPRGELNFRVESIDAAS